jgi:hypothetical protein
MPRARAANKYVSYEKEGIALLFVGGACRRDDVAIIDLAMETDFRAHQWGLRRIGGRLELVSSENIKAHRILLGYVHDWLAPHYRNGNHLDLRRANVVLRPRATAHPRSSNTEFGIRCSAGEYRARVCFKGRRLTKCFGTLVEARAWRKRKEVELYNEARRLTPYPVPVDPPRFPRCPPFINEDDEQRQSDTDDDDLYALLNDVGPLPSPAPTPPEDTSSTDDGGDGEDSSSSSPTYGTYDHSACATLPW